jgi:chemotaxis protein methyltransferase CheR
MLTSTLSKESPFVNVEDGITLAHTIVDTVRDPLMVLDHDLRVIAASRSFYKTFRLVRDEVRGGYRQRFPRRHRIHHSCDVQIQAGQGG